jgi:2-dehydro-3-deoxyphosphooctonate aldolase (KDO 8-P synthase)
LTSLLNQPVQEVKINNLRIANSESLVIIGGMNVLESESLAQEVCEEFKRVCTKLSLGFVFKASYDKANRSSINSFRGPGLKKGIEMLARVKDRYAVSILTDIHAVEEADPVAEVADVLQLPAFLSRQTDLVIAMAKTQAVINIKKAQFLAPHEMQHILIKFREAGNNRLMLCERGSSFGYNNLVVDMLGFPMMKSLQVPLLFDVTHSLQLPGGRVDSADGRRQHILSLAKAGVAQGIAGLFLEAHPDPDKARCDGPCALPLKALEPLLTQLKELDDLIKRQPSLEIQ